MHLNSWFEKAISYNEYVDQMTRNKEKMLSIYERYHLKDESCQKTWRITGEKFTCHCSYRRLVW